MTTRVRPICYGCKHLKPDLACDAFPEGIPEPILQSEADHQKPYEGDGGIQFEPKNKAAADYAKKILR